MPYSWQARGQLGFLKARVEEFKAAQQGKKLKKFYKTVYADFFELWPDPDSEIFEVTPPQLTKKGKLSQRKPTTKPREVKKFDTVELWMRDREQKIYTWFYNHTSSGRRGKARMKFNINVGSTTKPRVLSEANLYSKTYYNTRVKSKVDAKLKGVEDPGMRIAITKRCLHESWAAETNAIKTEIRELRKTQLKERKREEEIVERIFSGRQDPDDMEPEEYLLAQESIDEIIDEILDLIATRTGWAVSLNIGGPDMSKVNGEITVKTYHVGNPKGNVTFWTETPGYDDIHAKPFRSWCRKFFPESTRLRRAVNIDKSKVKNPQELVEAGREHGHLIYVETPDTPEEIAARQSRIAAERERLNTDAGDPGTGPDREDDGEGANDEGEEAQGEGLGNEDASGREDGGEDEEAEMTWVHTDGGIPVPVFVPRNAGATRAPHNNSVGDEDLPNPDASQHHPSAAPTEQPPALHPSGSLAPVNEWSWNDTFQRLGPDSVDGGLNVNGEVWAGAASSGGAVGIGGGAANGVWTGAGGGVDMGGGSASMMPMNNMLSYDATGMQMFGSGGWPMGDGGLWNEGGNVPENAMARFGMDGGGAAAVDAAAHGGMGHTNFGVMGTGGVALGGNSGMGTAEGNANFGLTTMGLAMMGTHGGVTVNTGVGGIGNTAAGAYGMWNSVTLEKSVEAMGMGSGKGMVDDSRVGGEPTIGPTSCVKEGVTAAPGCGAAAAEKRKQGGGADEAPEQGQRAKRLRQVPAATELPEWIDLAYGHLKLGMTHALWLKVVELWYQFERSWAAKGMSQSGRMPTAKRPTELGTWLPAPRQYDTIPTLSNVHAFADQWRAWWVGIQPECRRGGEGKLPKVLTKNMNISSLKKGGGLGLVVVLIGLRWWGDCPELGDAWEQAVEDMAAVFRRFLEG